MTSNGSVSSEKDEGLSRENMRELKSLRPHHESEQHDMYVKALKQAVRQREVTNIALSGPYGVGKSSILQGFRKHHPLTWLIVGWLGCLGAGCCWDCGGCVGWGAH